ncbi:hypothetical protein CR970_03815 [Candidatus Saccharibacteria bacterium]|nr:MAG: hypothetical protein CR970_03815 [Candidatus Saccharibacteria bacterium]
MDSIQDLLSARLPQEPPEVRVIKQFVRETYQAEVGVSIQAHAITILAPGAALAGTLRPHLRTFQRLCDTNKRIVIRIQRQ